MKKLKIIYFISLALLLYGCETTETSETTTTTTTTTTKTLAKIEVVNINGIIQSGVTVEMFDVAISDIKPSIVISTAITGSNGIATFDLESYNLITPKTFYFGVFKDYGNFYELSGKCTVENIEKGTEYTKNLILLK